MPERENSTGKGQGLDLDSAGTKKTSTGIHSAASAPTPTARPLPCTASRPGFASGSGTSAPRQPTEFQKAQLSSAFQGAREAESKAARARLLGKTSTRLFADDDDELTAIGVTYDGESPAKELNNRDVYIFVWDVSRAMNCEIPHFVGAKELSLGQTVDWLRHEGPMRGWIRASVDDAHLQAKSGLLVVATPRDLKLRQMAVVLPDEETSADKKPYVAAAAKLRGNRLTLTEALGVVAVDCFVHL